MKNESELISVIMPVYNTDRYITEAINSVLNQTYQDIELIVIDDASNDNSSKIINSFNSSKIKYIKLEKNSGAANARNVGINQSSGNIICFIDSDDIWEIEKLEKQYKFLKENNVGFCYTKYKKLYGNGKVKEIKYKISEKATYDELLKNTEIGTSTVMIDTKIIKKEYILMKHYRTCEDTATWLRITKRGFDAYLFDEYLTFHRVRKRSLPYNKLRNVINMYKIYRNQEKKSVIESLKLIFNYGINAIDKRVK